MIYYACVAKESTILAEFNSGDPDLAALAAECLEKTPPLHAFFSHTVGDKTYTFLIDDPFVYFAIHRESLTTSEGLAFLNSVKGAFNRILDRDGVGRSENFGPHRFQGELGPVFHQLLAANSEFSRPQRPVLKLESARSFDAPGGRKTGSVLLVGENLGGGLIKKKKRVSVDRNGDSREVSAGDNVGVSEDGNGLSMQKSGLLSTDGGHQKQEKRVWKKQVWVVLLFDLIVCSILFGVWLWICRGFKCIDG